jgi:predicted DsbA family dithiol-disulfide isomerase
MTLPVEIYVDPSCPWAWITHAWLVEVAPARDLEVRWRPYCLEIRDEYDVAPTVPPERRDLVLAAHVLSHRMLRVMEAARAERGDEVVELLYAAWGKRFFGSRDRSETVLADVAASCGLDAELLRAADDEKWDEPILAAMDIAYVFGGSKTQTPTIVVRQDPPHGFKGPVMAPAPTGDAAVELWDAIQVLSRQESFFEITRPRVNRPVPRV